VTEGLHGPDRHWGVGESFEGAVTAGCPSDATTDSDATENNRALIELWSCNGGSNERWTLG